MPSSSLSEHPIGANSIPAHFNFPGVPVRLAPTIVEVELNDEDVFDDDKARRDAISSFENILSLVDKLDAAGVWMPRT